MKSLVYTFSSACLALSLGLAAQAQSQTQPTAEQEPRSVRLATAPQQSVEGRPLNIYRFGEGTAEFVFLFGAFHGDEPQGPYLLQRLMDVLSANPAYYQDKSIFVMPVVNPDGLQRKTRMNARKVDLNRNFPTRDYQANQHRGTRYYAGPKALSEPESATVYELLKPYVQSVGKDKIKILSIHAPLAVNNFDGLARPLAERMAVYNGYKAIKDIGYPTPGSFGTYYGKEHGLAMITLETSSESAPRAWERHREALLALLQFPDKELYPELVIPSLRPEPQSTPRPEPSESPEALLSPPAADPAEPAPRRWWPLPQATPEPTPEPTPLPTPVPESTLPPVLAPVATPEPTPAAYQPGSQKLPPLSVQAWIKVSKKDQRLYVLEQSKVIASFPVSTGLGAKDTPNGTFKLLTRVVEPPYSGSPHLGKRYYPPRHPNNPLGSRWMQINGWHYRTGAMLGIHGTDDPENIGKAVSGGCVRMHNQDVELLFERLRVGMKVVIATE